MVNSEKLENGQDICSYNFEGVPFENLSSISLVSEEDIKQQYSGNANGLNQILAFLKKLDKIRQFFVII